MQLRTALMASVAALFLLLTIPVVKPGTSAGFPIVIAKTTTKYCGDGRLTVLEVADENWVRVYDGPVATLRTYELERRLQETFRTRAIAVAYITANRDLPFRRIAEVIDIASRQADHVAILTPAVEHQFGGCLTINPRPDSSLRATLNRR